MSLVVGPLKTKRLVFAKHLTSDFLTGRECPKQATGNAGGRIACGEIKLKTKDSSGEWCFTCCESSFFRSKQQESVQLQVFWCIQDAPQRSVLRWRSSAVLTKKRSHLPALGWHAFWRLFDPQIHQRHRTGAGCHWRHVTAVGGGASWSAEVSMTRLANDGNWPVMETGLEPKMWHCQLASDTCWGLGWLSFSLRVTRGFKSGFCICSDCVMSRFLRKHDMRNHLHSVDPRHPQTLGLANIGRLAALHNPDRYPKQFLIFVNLEFAQTAKTVNITSTFSSRRAAVLSLLARCSWSTKLSQANSAAVIELDCFSLSEIMAQRKKVWNLIISSWQETGRTLKETWKDHQASKKIQENTPWKTNQILNKP